MPDTPALYGVLPVLQTPYDEKGEIDDATLRREIDWVLRNGAHGVTTGMVSEILRLSSTERLHLTEVVCDAARSSGAPVVISCGAESTRTAVQFAEQATAHGATAVMANPPVTVGPTDADLLAYYSAIVESAGIPVIVQDASGYVGRPLSIDLQVTLLDRYGDLVYFKPEAPPIGQRLSQLRDATGGRARIFEGSGGAALLDSYRRSVVGTMPGAEVCWAIRAMWDALEIKDWDRAYRISGPLGALVALQVGIDGFVAVEKHLLCRQGVFRSAAARGPKAFTLDDETLDEVDRVFDLLRTAVDQFEPRSRA